MAPLSLQRLAVTLLLSSTVLAQNKADELSKCLDEAGVRNVIQADGSSTWSQATAGYQRRIKAEPASVAYPKTRDEVALSLKCARDSGVKASALGAGHSFTAFAFGTPGALVIDMAAFNELKLDSNNILTFGGGVHVGPTAKYLWDTASLHIPHVRGSHVGVTGSSIGGGFGTTSRHLGLPLDNLVEVEYMLANGTIVHAGKGSDLLWAAKGAGASFGIILSSKTKTHKPAYDKAINFTLSIGNVSPENGAKALVAIQDYVTTQAPDEFALRWNLMAQPYDGIGYFYGNPDDFDKVVEPLVKKLEAISSNVLVKKTVLPWWDLEVQIAGQGMNQPDGGFQGISSFYIQSLAVTKPLTQEQAQILFESTTLKFNRTDMRKFGYLDLWGGVSRDISDSDTSFAHGKNFWLIRWDANSLNPLSYPADGIKYMRSLMKPFEEALVKSGEKLRGFVNYADDQLTEEEWSSRLYGANYARLKKIKAEVDPEGLFTNHKQSIPAPQKS
ncbi:berberine bridge enzyme [Fusarium heterosporum]|uniref:Berberine bridge enzyme n=1 Tax=Fusarium heterosporum TaxID=42747 RepID=A0A8H5WXT6_FUSHE|nr:berberine bridge enzyme [Fusarium heterosporum]